MTRAPRIAAAILAVSLFLAVALLTGHRPADPDPRAPQVAVVPPSTITG
jgi:hypothetical protein